jgi:hypothetical protein
VTVLTFAIDALFVTAREVLGDSSRSLFIHGVPERVIEDACATYGIAPSLSLQRSLYTGWSAATGCAINRDGSDVHLFGEHTAPTADQLLAGSRGEATLCGDLTEADCLAEWLRISSPEPKPHGRAEPPLARRGGPPG